MYIMGKLQASSVSAGVDGKEVIITDGKHSLEPPDIRVVRINTHGTSPAELEADKAIVSNKRDNDKRRTVKLERSKLSASWGFTLQSYGIYNASSKCIEDYTYVDYVEMKSPAYLSGMRRSDIIFAVDGQSTESLTHSELVERIKGCKSSMRMVLVNSNICQKVELHQRRQKLQALLRQKQSELKGLENREAALQFKVKARLRQKETRRQKLLTDDNHTETVKLHQTAITNNQLTVETKSKKPTIKEKQHTVAITENNNVETTRKSPSSTSDSRDARPKLTAYMAKLSLPSDDGLTAYERTLLNQGAHSRRIGASTSPRVPKRTNTAFVRSESLRLGKESSSQSSVS